MWAHIYSPTTLEDVILPEKAYADMREIIDTGKVPNLFLSGSAGIGKTTVAQVIASELDYETLVINASKDGNIDTLRTDIDQFASTFSFNGKPKVVILDEADYLSAATQAALRGFMDAHSKNCSFILTANFPNKVIEAVRSRLESHNFRFPASEKPQLAKRLFRSIEMMMKDNDVEYDRNDLREFLVKNLATSTDIRAIITKAQILSRGGKFDPKAEVDLDERFTELKEYLRKKDFTKIRKWAGENADIEASILFRHLYDHAKDIVEPVAIPQLVLLINDHQYRHAFVVDAEINVAALLTNIMLDCVK